MATPSNTWPNVTPLGAALRPPPHHINFSTSIWYQRRRRTISLQQASASTASTSKWWKISPSQRSSNAISAKSLGTTSSSVKRLRPLASVEEETTGSHLVRCKRSKQSAPIAMVTMRQITRDAKASRRPSRTLKSLRLTSKEIYLTHQ